jgi:predicted nucleic acid-binding protein
VRIFFDTNVLVSAFATRGLCEDLFRVALAKHEVVIGEVVIEELERVLVDKLHVPAGLIDEAIELLRNQTVVENPAQPADCGVDDPDDSWVIGSALDADVDVFVTGDRGILRIAGDLELAIVDPRGMWEMLKSEEHGSVHSG